MAVEGGDQVKVPILVRRPSRGDLAAGGRARHCRAAALAPALAVLLLASCATSGGGGSAPRGPADEARSDPFPLAASDSPPGSGRLSARAEESLGSFSTFVLSNGLPVIVKRSSASEVEHIALVVRGGSAAAEIGKAGVESLALATMARGSAALSYEAIQSVLDETSSTLESYSSFDYSIYGLTTLGKYFGRLFPIWADTIAHPAFRKADFDKELSEAKLALQSKQQDPWAKTGLEMNRILFASHPYAASPDGTPESLDSIALGDVRTWYASRMAAGSLFVVAVGRLDPKDLRRKLEASLGGLPAGNAPASAAVPSLARPGAWSLAKVEFPGSKGMGYLRGDFAAPPYSAPDYMALSLGASLFSDLLFRVVRDEHGAVYSAESFIRGFKANYGSIALFKTPDPGAAKAYVDEAAAILASGRAVAIDPRASPDGYAPISEVLEAAKARFLNELYESQATNSAIAGRIAASVVETGDYRSYLLDADRIESVTAEQVRAAVGKYILDGRIDWVALGSSEVLASVSDSGFRGFGR